MMLDTMTWQWQNGVWVFGELVRGIVRHPIADVYLNPSFGYYTWSVIKKAGGTEYGNEPYLTQAIKAAEACVVLEYFND